MIQDYAIEVSTDQAFTGASPDGLPYVASSKTISLLTVQNTLVDIGQGATLVMEFEISTAFTGYVSAVAIPQIQLCVAVGDATLANNVTILGSAGYPLSATKVEQGFAPSDAVNTPNLFAGDRFYVKLPGMVPGSPFYGGTSVRTAGIMPGASFLGAYYILPMRTAQTVQMSNPALWTATNFTAGAIKTRLLINQPIHDGRHHYTSRMVVR